MLDNDIKFTFQGGEIVRLLHDHPDLNLKAGDQGYVWGVYDLLPPLYEADFYGHDGSSKAMMFQAEEVEVINDLQQVRIPEEDIKFYKSLSNQSVKNTRTHNLETKHS